MTDTKKTSRRNFLKASSTAVAGATALGSLNIARSAHAAGDDVIKVALIGCGGRGTGAVDQQLSADKNVKLVAVADAFEYRATGVVERTKKKYGAQVDVPPERVFVGLDAYKKAIDSGADLISIATPPGFRPGHYAAAIAAGKHVFMEKPCCVDGVGFRQLMDANKMADDKNLFVAVGLQRRHEPKYMENIQRIHDGALGDVMFTRVFWNGGGIWNRGREEGMSEMEYQVHNWYHFCWLSGDNICEQHIHNLDVGNWVQDAHPIEANGMGGCERRYAGNAKGTGQIFDHHFVEFTYENGAKMYSQCRHMKGCWTNVSEEAIGTQGRSDCRGTIEGENAWQFSGDSKVRGHLQEQLDLIAAIRAGNRYNEGYYGATSSMTAVLGRLATYSGKIVTWDDAVASDLTEFPKNLAWDAPAPVQKDANGDYPIPVPGEFKIS
jgi:predicted dehydrogenase